MEIQHVIENFSTANETLNKVANPFVVIDEVLSWTNGQVILTKSLFELILASETYIAEGDEEVEIANLVQTRIVDKCEPRAAAAHLKKIREALLNNNYKTAVLFKLYEILCSKDVRTDTTPQVTILLSSNVVVVQDGNLQIANIIYRSVFNQAWIQKESSKAIEDNPQVYQDSILSEDSFPRKNNKNVNPYSSAKLRSIVKDLLVSFSFGFESGLIFIILVSLLGTIFIATGMWLLLLLIALVWMRVYRWNQLIILIAIAVATFALILLFPFLRSAISENYILVICFLASLVAVFTLIVDFLSNQFYKLLASKF